MLLRDFYDGAFLRSNGVGLRRKYHGVASTPTLGSSRSSSDRDDPLACDAALHTSHSGPVPPPDMHLSLVRHISSNPLFWRYSTVRLAIYYLTPHMYSSPKYTHMNIVTSLCLVCARPEWETDHTHAEESVICDPTWS